MGPINDLPPGLDILWPTFLPRIIMEAEQKIIDEHPEYNKSLVLDLYRAEIEKRVVEKMESLREQYNDIIQFREM